MYLEDLSVWRRIITLPLLFNLTLLGLIQEITQIYLTFPSETSFTDEDVSYYFSDFGTVEDVRIPYQQQRMYGFVTFSNAETVRIILARGNPHFICDSRVLVKPYKEKGKILQNKWQQLMERGSYSASSSPSGMDLYECHLG
ncbi:BnaC06g04640D [Brassica napus]|uniref:BnaC06g04640D protein n=1 Tax=Brassica napus TaxID=3708 RepID=A0A078IFX7_BRANA|nr:BnaC06g04640D [Brassica napus]